MALYYYSKYNIEEYYSWSWGSTTTMRDSFPPFAYTGYIFDETKGYFEMTGQKYVDLEPGQTRYGMKQGTMYEYSNLEKIPVGQGYRWYAMKAVVSGPSNRRGSLVQSNIIAENGTYPRNGISGSYWYVRGSIITPTVPRSISLAGEFKGGKEVTIDWGTSNYVTNYRLERQLDGGAWVQIYSGADAFYTDIIPRGTNTVAYRVRVYGNTQYSGYVTSPTRTVKNFPEMGLKVNNQLKMGEQGWVKVNGQLRNIDTMWIKTNGVLREV